MHTAEKALASELLRTGWHVLILTANDTSQHHVTRDLLLDNPTVCVVLALLSALSHRKSPQLQLWLNSRPLPLPESTCGQTFSAV